jgi:hypothetical protein
MRTRVAGVLVLGASLAGAGGVRAQAAQSEQGPPPTNQARESRKPTPDELGVSLDRIKFALAQAQPLQLKIKPDAPTFRVQIVERQRPWLLNFQESLKIPWAPVPSGGSDYYEFMKMVTPPQAQPFGAFSSSELPVAIAQAYVVAAMMYGIKQAAGSLRNAYRGHVQTQAHDTVMRELEEFLRTHPDAPRPIWWVGTIK